MKNKTTKTNIDNTKAWLSSSKVRPKTVVITLSRTQHGYLPKKATVVSKTNQYTSQNVDVDVDLIMLDLNKKGIINR